ncbi:SDR family NAD(P)-dependent oxidoreductase [Ramlibacter sp. WS9]|uniref:SDR family NAD(P)-dependent oxidoreductase n=1 Tax=Ramlibacter sp. WS9 TaxID=1882741 RepID=UPI0018EE4AA0|nr:SDR family oxidoreductase [Ramlibacter sp. WS9]HSV36689.1 SDR family oxidoreductase [Ramlibacter sp.]
MAALKGKVALVCGASSGIGAAVVWRFAQEAATVLACGMPLPPFPGALTCDVTDEAQVRAAVAAALERHGRIDVLVNAAGVIVNDDAADIEDSVWSRQHEINLAGTMRTMRAVLPHMLSRGTGSVVNIASVAAFNAGAGSASYGASKAGVVALTRSAAQAYGAQGVRVNALCPGWVDTPMAAKEMQDIARELGITEAQARERTVARIALARMARPEEMAAVCLFLACDESSFITGAALVADGGARMPAAARGI